MNEKKPIRTIVDKDNGAIVGFACATCGAFYSAIAGADEARKNAESCHNPDATCFNCGGPTERLWENKCAACHAAENAKRREDDAKRELAKFTKAPKVKLADYTGAMLWFPDPTIGDDGFIPSDEVDDYFDDDAEPGHEYAWACAAVGFGMDADSIIENALSDHHEDAGENIGNDNRKELQALLDAWCSKQHVTSYEPINEAVILRGDDCKSDVPAKVDSE